MDETLLEKVIDGDVLAWHTLWHAIEPTVWQVTGKWQLVGKLCKRDDDRRNIVVEVMNLLREQGHRRIRIYLDSRGTRERSSFKSWLATVTARASIDYLRAHPEFDDARGRPGAAPKWVHVVPMADPDARAVPADASSRAAVAQLLDRARRDLRPDQLAALSLWLEGSTAEEIDEELVLGDAPAADRLVRSALKRLRDRFATTTLDTLIMRAPERIEETT